MSELLDSLDFFKSPTPERVSYLFKEIQSFGKSRINDLTAYVAKHIDPVSFENQFGCTLLSLAQPYPPVYAELEQKMPSKTLDMKAKLQEIKNEDNQENMTPNPAMR